MFKKCCPFNKIDCSSRKSNHEHLLQTSRIQYEPSCNITEKNILKLSRNIVKDSEGRRCPSSYYVRSVKFRVKIKGGNCTPSTLTLAAFYFLLITSKDAFQIPYFMECKWIIIDKKRWYGSVIKQLLSISSCYYTVYIEETKDKVRMPRFHMLKRVGSLESEIILIKICFFYFRVWFVFFLLAQMHHAESVGLRL